MNIKFILHLVQVEMKAVILLTHTMEIVNMIWHQNHDMDLKEVPQLGVASIHRPVNIPQEKYHHVDKKQQRIIMLEMILLEIEIFFVRQLVILRDVRMLPLIMVVQDEMMEVDIILREINLLLLMAINLLLVIAIILNGKLVVILRHSILPRLPVRVPEINLIVVILLTVFSIPHHAILSPQERVVITVDHES
jgi:hypothetical protein